ncbi:MAG TPA: nitrile hydratase subunit beta [Caldimonas sp.]|nr:nitrile hydratase subunit beta [Caldimonas sp.]
MTDPGTAYRTHADVGGRADERPVRPEPDEPPFHAAWEGRALALTLAMGATGSWNLDMTRAARETLPDYAELDYYRIWLAALERLIVAHGLAEPAELEAGRSLRPARSVGRVLQAQDVAPALARGSPTERPPPGPARFALGDSVRTRAQAVPHHTRLPGYARGKLGYVRRVHGAHVYADAHAQGLGEAAQWLYTVAFDARELWGDGAAAGCIVSIDAWEPYLEPAAVSPL